LLALICCSKQGDLSGCSVFFIPETKILLSGRFQFYWFFFLFMICPVVLGFLGVVGWSLCIYVFVASYILLLYEGAHNAIANNGTLPKPYPKLFVKKSVLNNTSAWFCLLFIFVGYIVLKLWPYVDSHRITFPYIIADLIALPERCLNAPIFGCELGSMSSSVAGDTQAIVTRSGSIGLAGNRVEPTVFLLSTENIHSLLLLLMLIGSTLRSLILLQKNRIKNILLDIVTVVFVAVVFISITWSDILRGQHGVFLHRVRIWSC